MRLTRVTCKSGFLGDLRLRANLTVQCALALGQRRCKAKRSLVVPASLMAAAMPLAAAASVEHQPQSVVLIANGEQWKACASQQVSAHKCVVGSELPQPE